MNKHILFFLLVLGLVFSPCRVRAADEAAEFLPSSVEPPQSGLSFLECYRAALKRSETVAIQGEALVQANELERQAKAAFLPQLSGSATWLRQERPSPPNSAGSVAQNTVKLTATQPLFRGFREFAAVRQRQAQTEAERAALQTAALELFYDVADAYYATLALESDMRNLRNELAVNRQREKDLEGFRKVGRSRTTEVLTQRAHIASLEAQLEATHGQLQVQREVLAFLTDLPHRTPLKDADALPIPGALEGVESYLASVDTRPDVRSSVASLTGSESAISLARGQHWPTLDLLGNYYLERPGSLSTVNWDLQLALSVPLFSGGAVQSQVRQALSMQEQASLALARMRRRAEEEIRRYHRLVSAESRQVAKLREFAALSQQNYQAELRDYRNGLVTNLEVLQSITSWQVAQRSLERQQYALKVDFLKLEGAAARRKDIFLDSAKVD